MVAGDEDDDDDGFTGYVPQTEDLGPSLMIIGVFSFLVGYLILLPLLIWWSSRREAQQRGGRQSEADQTFQIEGPEAEDHHTGRKEQPIVVVDGDEDSKKLLEDDDGSSCDHHSTTSSHKSTASSHSSSVISSAVAAILDQPHIPKSKKSRRKQRRRRRKEKEIQTKRWVGDWDENGRVDVTALTTTLMQGIHPGGAAAVTQVRMSENSSSSAKKNQQRQQQSTTASRDDDDDTDDAFVDLDHPEFSVNPSDRFTDDTKPKFAEDFTSLGVLDKIAAIMAHDIETRRILRIATPFCVQALITGLTDTLNVAVIGKLIGTREVSAYVIVNMLIELTSEFVGGLHEALSTLCSQAIGANNKKLAGEYVQIVVVLYTLFFLPFMILWSVYMDAALRWLGFDEETVQMGKQYTYILVVDLLIDGLGESIHGLLDVAGFERFSSSIGAMEEVLAFVVLFFVGFFGNPDLVTVGMIQLGMGLLFLAMNVVIIYWKGWFKPYLKGMVGTFALWNGKAVWLVCHTALSLSFGMLLTDGEWEILTIFASFLGPAEVAAWGILDTIWQSAHELIDGLADASEVRCAFLLGSGDPNRARLSAYKSMMLCTFAALFLTALIYMAGDDLPTWLTSDPTLQKLLSDLLPLFGLANFVMALDTMSWTLLGSQGRYRLATLIVCIASWTVTIPLSVLFSVHLKVNLQGQMTAFAIGYLVMGITHSYFLFRSNWEYLSVKVMEDHEAALRRDEEPGNTITSSRCSPASATSAASGGGSNGSKMLPMEIASSGKADVEDRC